ncbi:MAG: DUF3667 domain-containing protein [Arenimonas sp.]
MENINPDSNLKASPRCENCGVRKRPERLSLTYMLHRLREDVLGTERGLFITVWHLFARPQEVVSGFVKGDNLRYYSPIKYFVVMLALSLVLPNDAVLDDFVAGFVGSLKIGSLESAKAFVSDWNALVYLPMVTMLALSTRIFFRDKGYNIAEHLVVAAYGWAHLVLLSTVAFSMMHLFQWLGADKRLVAPLFFFPYLYWFWYCRAVFSQKKWSGWLRAFATLPTALVCYFLFVGFLLVMTSAIMHMMS